MKSFLTILLLCSAIFALIDETPATNAVSESQKTDLTITTDSGQRIKVNTDELQGLAHTHGHRARKARLTQKSSRKAADASSSTISFSIGEFTLSDFPSELQSEVENLQDAVAALEKARNEESEFGVCVSKGDAKVIAKALDNYEEVFVTQNADVLEDLIDVYEEMHDDDDRKKKTARGLEIKQPSKSSKKSRRRLHNKH